MAYSMSVIKTFNSKALAELWSKGSSAKMDARMQGRVLRRLEFLNQAKRPEDVNVPGLRFSPAEGVSAGALHRSCEWSVVSHF